MNDLHTAYEALRKEASAFDYQAKRAGRIKAERLERDADVMRLAMFIVQEMIQENG